MMRHTQVYAGHNASRVMRARTSRSAMYVMVLVVSTVVLVIGLSAIASARIQSRAAAEGLDVGSARALAHSAIEMGRWAILHDSNWRTALPNGPWYSNAALGTGSLSLLAADPRDGNIANWPRDNVVLTATGRKGRASYMLATTLVPEVQPLDALRTSLHAVGAITVLMNSSAAVPGGPLSSNATITTSGTIHGDVEALAVIGFGITGTTTLLAPAKSLPAASLVDTYIAAATALTTTGDIANAVLAPGYNSLGGGTNADGVYYLDANSTAKITGVRVNGTLIIGAPGKTVCLKDDIFLAAYRPDYPALIVDGNLDLRYTSDSKPLSESTIKFNFNPPGAPYRGVSNATQTDSYPHEIQGLVWVTGNLTIGGAPRIRGCVLVGGSVTISGNIEVIHDDGLYQNPPVGFESSVTMKPQPGSWTQVVLP